MEHHDVFVQRVIGGAIALGFRAAAEVHLGRAGRADVVIYERGADALAGPGPVVVAVEVKTSLRTIGERRAATSQALRYAAALGCVGWAVGPWVDFQFGPHGSRYANGVYVGSLEDLFSWLRDSKAEVAA